MEHFLYFLKKCAELSTEENIDAKKKILNMFVKEIIVYEDKVEIVIYTIQKENTPQRVTATECSSNVLIGGGDESRTRNKYVKNFEITLILFFVCSFRVQYRIEIVVYFTVHLFSFI